MSIGVQVVIDCADPGELSQFWAAALGYEFPPPPQGFDTWEAALRSWGVPESEFNSAGAIEDPQHHGPRIYFQRVPEPKSVKNRLHLDLNITTGSQPLPERKKLLAEAAERLVKLGARISHENEDRAYSIVMLDPEQNEFCVH